MPRQSSIAVIGAGVIGSAVAYALAREGHKVVLLDRAEPGVAGASYGNVGHIASELVEPLPSPQLLFGFWRELVAFDGPLDIRLGRLPAMLPWIARFAAAAFRRKKNTTYLAPLVKDSRATLERWLSEIGRPELLKCNGHYELWQSARAAELAQAQARAMERLGVRTEPAPQEIMDAARQAAQSATSGIRPTLRGDRQAAPCESGPSDEKPAVADERPANSGRGSATAGQRPVASGLSKGGAGLWFPDTGHVADPLEIVRAFAAAAAERGAQIRKAEVRALEVNDTGLRVVTDAPEAEAQPLRVAAAVICTGAWARRLLEPFDLNVPMEAARGYHIEMPNHPPLVDAPVLYADQRVVVTPMAGRLRASTYMEFAHVDAPPDPRKPRRLREKVRSLGYDCPLEGPSWVGPRPVLPDYLPGIGRVPGPANVFYAIGHQHIGLTLAAVTGDLVEDLVAGRHPQHDVSAFDLRRFG
jgi:glycine/D-amino acid oxidase-like deaminating enzyme